MKHSIYVHISYIKHLFCTSFPLKAVYFTFCFHVTQIERVALSLAILADKWKPLKGISFHFQLIKLLQSFLKMMLHRCFFVICCQLLDFYVSKDFKKYLFSGAANVPFFCLGNFLTHDISGVTVLLALTVFNTMVNEILPKVSDALPILG